MSTRDFSILLAVLLLAVILFAGLVHMNVISGWVLEGLMPRVWAAELPPRVETVDQMTLRWLQEFCGAINESCIPAVK